MRDGPRQNPTPSDTFRHFSTHSTLCPAFWLPGCSPLAFDIIRHFSTLFDTFRHCVQPSGCPAALPRFRHHPTLFDTFRHCVQPSGCPAALPRFRHHPTLFDTFRHCVQPSGCPAAPPRLRHHPTLFDTFRHIRTRCPTFWLPASTPGEAPGEIRGLPGAEGRVQSSAGSGLRTYRRRRPRSGLPPRPAAVYAWRGFRNACRWPAFW
jgi:hypothetical protein